MEILNTSKKLVNLWLHGATTQKTDIFIYYFLHQTLTMLIKQREAEKKGNVYKLQAKYKCGQLRTVV
jgi:hypothetical protein